MNIPLTTFDGYLKSIRLDSLEPHQQAALRIAFGEFFTDEQKNRAAQASVSHVFEHMQKQGFECDEQQPYRYRRYSGGESLPRARYFSVATDQSGEDGCTLVQEVSSYTDHSKSGRVIVFDSIDADSARRISENFKLRSFTVPPRSLVMLFFHDQGYPSPLVHHLVSTGLLQKPDNYFIAVQYRVEQKEIANVIDLRHPPAQRWLYEVITQGLPGLAYYYGSYLVKGLVIQGPRPMATDKDLAAALNHGGTGKTIWYPPRTGWEGDLREGPADFFGLLPFLIYPGRGGSPITEAIGRHLRHLGVSGLVYPSVRTDVVCECRGNEIKHSIGWNFVDYRETPGADRAAWIVMSPDSWWGLIGRYTDVRRSADGNSWSIVGNYRGGLEWFVQQQRERARAFAENVR